MLEVKKCPECLSGDLLIEAKSTIFVDDGIVSTECEELLEIFIREGRYICASCTNTFSYNDILNQSELDECLEEIWKDFGDKPFYEKDSIEYLDEEFHIWNKGTSKESIWHWFDDNHSKGVYYLLYKNFKNK